MLKLSVIMPIYKSELYLKRGIDSILKQHYSNIELILVDDGSPDQCPQICDEYAELDQRVKVIHQKNAGVAAARNAGLRKASGDYIIFVDSDDYIEHDMYSSMVEIIESYHCDVVMCDCVKEFPDHSEIYTHDIRGGYYDAVQLKKEYYPHLLMMENVEYPATISNYVCMFRNVGKDSKKYVEYEKGIRYSEDLLFGARLMRHAESFYYLKGKIGYHYCMNPESATHVFVKDKWKDYQKLHQKIKQYFQEDEGFDFSNQIDLCLLFFLYNACGDIICTNKLNKKQKKGLLEDILNTESVREMFGRINVFKLQISWKLKIVTLLYKYRKIYLLMK